MAEENTMYAEILGWQQSQEPKDSPGILCPGLGKSKRVQFLLCKAGTDNFTAPGLDVSAGKKQPILRKSPASYCCGFYKYSKAATR